MGWLRIGLVVLAMAAVIAVCLVVVTRRLTRREPYASFMRLKTRSKITFFRMVVADARVPRFVKVLPFFLVLYLVSPIDLIPDFIPVLGALDDVAMVLATLALIMRLTPRYVVDDLLAKVSRTESL